jgi:ribonuclease E
MGKISRFGLMELSRQRLRPALSEGSHVTCPRCNGVGVIRDTESSALHILRILQEEAMKEGTAAVHAQVPVEVASFLLNEKRADIAKIEARLRVSVVLIPNKFLDTPHYHIERLRHDDARLDESKLSFERAAELAPSTDTPYTVGRTEEERARPKQEAVVKGIVPETPAPIPTLPQPFIAPARVAPAKPSLWSKIVAFFSGGPQPEPAPVAAAAPASGDRPTRDSERRGDRRRGRNDRDRHRDARRDEKRGERRDEKRDDKREEKRDARRDEPRREERRPEAQKPEARDRRPERPQDQRAPDAGEARKPRGDRRPRKPEAAAGEPVAVVAPEEAPPTAAIGSLVTADAGTVEGTQEERGGRRRRRRRGRGGRGEEAGVAGIESPGSDLSETAGPDETPDEEPAVVLAAQPQPAVPDATIASDIVVPRAPELIRVAATALPIAQPAPLAVEQLQPVLELAGLTLVQTAPDKHAEALARMASEPAPIRAPRERAALPPVEEGPLIQVETRRPIEQRAEM